MKITIINGTNRTGNKSIKVTTNTAEIINELGYESSIVTMNNFKELFTGNYLNFIEANTNQKIDLENMQSADVLIFVSPTYHHGIPAALKNFLEIIKEKVIYENKVIGLISSNSSGRAYGAYQAMEVLHGIIAYNKLNSYIISTVPIIDHENIDNERICEFIKYCSSLLNLTKNNIKL